MSPKRERGSSVLSARGAARGTMPRSRYGLIHPSSFILRLSALGPSGYGLRVGGETVDRGREVFHEVMYYTPHGQHAERAARAIDDGQVPVAPPLHAPQRRAHRLGRLDDDHVVG